jgi:PAS domain S-box-containing protein
MDDPLEVLHVDDRESILELSRSALAAEHDHIDVATETRARDGLETIERCDIDCVVSDYEMPRMDGMEFLRAVREQWPTLPFVLFTGEGSEDLASEAIATGCTDYVQKGGGTEQYDLLANRIENAVEHHRARRELERREKRFRLLVKETTDYFAVCAADGTVEYVSPAVEYVLGYDPDELLGSDAFTIVHPEDREAARDGLRTAVENPSSRPTVELRIEHGDGGWRILEAKGRSLLDDPAVEGILINARDITERVERERELERQKELFRGATDGVYTVDADRRRTPGADRVRPRGGGRNPRIRVGHRGLPTAGRSCVNSGSPSRRRRRERRRRPRTVGGVPNVVVAVSRPRCRRRAWSASRRRGCPRWHRRSAASARCASG